MVWIVPILVFTGHAAVGHIAERRKRRETFWTFLLIWALAGFWAFWQWIGLTGADALNHLMLLVMVVLPAIAGLSLGVVIAVVRRRMRRV